MITTILLVLILIDFIVFSALDRYVFSFVLAVGIGAAGYFFVPAVAEMVTALSWQTIALYTIGYCLVGGVVATIKWILLLLRVQAFIKECRLKFGSPTFKAPDTDPRLEFVKYVRDSSKSRVVYKHDDLSEAPLFTRDMWRSKEQHITKEEMDTYLTPVVGGYVARVALWILQWPFAVVGIFLDDIMLRIGRLVSDLIDVMFGRLGKFMVGRATEGM